MLLGVNLNVYFKLSGLGREEKTMAPFPGRKVILLCISDGFPVDMGRPVGLVAKTSLSAIGFDFESRHELLYTKLH